MPVLSSPGSASGIVDGLGNGRMEVLGGSTRGALVAAGGGRIPLAATLAIAAVIIGAHVCGEMGIVQVYRTADDLCGAGIEMAEIK